MVETLERLKAALADRYTLERELGRGGMATVYLARDLKHERLVALKVLRSDLAAVLGVERFLREIRLAARLQHPHILPLFDSGDAAGSLWYTMPFVEGESLRDRLARQGELPVQDAVGILRDVAGAPAHSGPRPSATPTVRLGFRPWTEAPRSRPTLWPANSATSRRPWCDESTPIWVRSGTGQTWSSSALSSTSTSWATDCSGSA